VDASFTSYQRHERGIHVVSWQDFLAGQRFSLAPA
jgi:hypothetical protein